MATIRLIPSTYYLSSTSYLSVSNESNMYDDCDSTDYATIRNSRTSTSSYYAYIRGFDFSQIPSAAVVSDFTVRIKCNYSGGYAQAMYLYDGTATSMGRSDSISSTVTTHEFTCNYSWEDVVAAGSDFGIRINCRRSSRNTTAYIYVYGAEIEVTYTVPDPRTITTSASGNGTISPSGTNTYYDGDEVELVITPTNKSDQVTATRDGADITSQLVAHGAGTTNTFTANYVDLTDIQSGSSYAEYAIGYTAEDPYSSSSNMYASDTGYADYSFDFSSIPSNAVIEDIEVRCHGHRESATIDSTHISRVTLYRGNTAISESEEFQYQSFTTVTLVPTTMPTRAELDSIVVRHLVGYYGGLVTGISFVVTYSVGSGLDHYTYTFTVSGDTTIVVVIGGSSQTMYFKNGSSWTAVSAVYVKTNGVWVKQSDLTNIFDSTKRYRNGS